jgi:hypothetical protein
MRTLESWRTVATTVMGLTGLATLALVQKLGDLYHRQAIQAVATARGDIARDALFELPPRPDHRLARDAAASEVASHS